MPDLTLLPLAFVVFFAFTVETALGFGATLISVALGSMLLPIPEVLAAILPLNFVLSCWLSGRYHAQLDRTLLLTRLLPWMALGMPLGIWLVTNLDASILKRVFGVFVVGVSLYELDRIRRGEVGAAPISKAGERAMLIAGGVVHGAFVTGGPMAVYVASRAEPDKGRYRATLAGLWATFGVVLLSAYTVEGRLNWASLERSAFLAPGALLGLVLGEVAHRRVPIEVFRALLFGLLTIAGVLLVARR